MTRCFRLTSLLLGAFVLACSDSAGPPAELEQSPVVQAADFRPLQWSAPATGTEATVVRNTVDGQEVLKDVAHLASGSVVSQATSGTTQHSFWAVQGEDRDILVYRVVATASGYQKRQVIELDVDDDTDMTLPNGTPLAEGDSVLITLTVTSDYVLSHLYPSGLQFDDVPAELVLWYDDAGLTTTEEAALRMWYQSDPGNPWSMISADQDTGNNEFEIDLDHFSGYAVAF